MAPTSDIRLVAFDLGGVVVRICRTWEEACAAAGVPVRAPLTAELLGALARWSERLQRGEVTEAEVAQGVAAATGGLYAPAEILAIQAATLKEPYEGVAELVRELGRSKVRTAVLSNTSPAHWQALRELEAVKATGLEVLSFRVGALKPEPAIYAAAEAAFGVPPASIAFFDDTAANVRAAEGRGWRARVVDPAVATAAQMRRTLAEWGVLAV